MRAEVGEIRASRGRAVVEIVERTDHVTESGLIVMRDNSGKTFSAVDDYEEAVVHDVGPGIVDIAVGDRVIIRAESGGAAGADIGPAMGRPRGEIVVVEQKELMCIVEG